MTYLNHFKHADDIVTHLQTVIPTLNDPILESKYIGFVAMASVTVYEVAIKDIFITFAKNKHQVLGSFAQNRFSRINGKIKNDNVQTEYISAFGQKYLMRFKKKLKIAQKQYLKKSGRDMLNSYNNMIVWRNDFVHEGRTNSTCTFQEVVTAYTDGKEFIKCIADTMVR